MLKLHLARTILVVVVFALFDLIGDNTRIFASALVDCALVPRSLAFGLELVAASAKFGNGLLCEKLLEGPFLDVLLLVLLQLCDELDSTLQNGAFVLLAARYDLCELVNALVDGLAATTLDYRSN